MDTKKLFLFLLLGMFMINLVSAVWYNPFSWGTEGIVEKEGSWYLDHIDGIQLEYFDTSIENLNNSKAKICLLPKTDLRINDDVIKQSRATLRKNNIETRQVEPADMEVETEGGKIKKMCVDVDYSTEDYIKFGENSAQFEYTSEMIIAYDDVAFFNDEYVEIGRLSLSTDFEYKNGKPNVMVGFGKQLLTHTFYLENYSSEAITNLRVIDMNTQEEIERNVNIKFLTYETKDVNTYHCLGEPSADQNCSINGTREIQVEKWNDINLANDSENYVIGIFSDVINGDYVDADFDYYGVSVLESPIDWTTWESDLLTDIYSWWKFDETTGTTAYDEVGNINLTNVGTANIGETTSIIGTSYEYRATDYLNKVNIGSSLGATNDFTYCSWLRPASLQGFGSTSGYFFMLGDSINPSRAINFDDANNQIKYRGANGGVASSSNSVWTGSTWYYICARYNGTGMEILKDGVSLLNASDSSAIATDPNLILGWIDTDYIYSGFMDEGGLWTRELSNEEILTLYNSTQDGCSYNNDTCFITNVPPVVDLISPSNATLENTNSYSGTFQYNVSDVDTSISNCTLNVWNITDNSLEYTQTDTSITNATVQNFSQIVASGNYTWNVYCLDNETALGYADSNYSLFIIPTTDNPPHIEDNSSSVANGSLFLTSPQSLNFYANNVWDDVNLANVSLEINKNSGGYVINQTNSSGTNNTNYAFENIAFNDGSYLWRISATDNVSQKSVTNVSSFVIDSIAPQIIITSPADLFEVTTFNETISLNWTFIEANPDFCHYNIGGSNISVNCSDNFTSFQYPTTNPDNITVTLFAQDDYNLTSSDSITILKNTIPPYIETNNLTDLATVNSNVNSSWSIDASDDNLNECYYNTTDHSTQVVTCNSTITTTWTTDGQKNITYCANDTLGNINCSSTTITIYLVEYTQTDIDPIAEGFSSTFTLNLTTTNLPTTNAYLVLEGTAYPYDRKFEYTNSDIYEVDVSIPDGLGNTTGIKKEWYWTYNITGLYVNKNTDTENITIYSLEIDDCTTYGDKILEIELKDEELNTLVDANGSRIEVDLSIISSENLSFVETFNLTWTDENNVSICVPSGLLGTYEYIIEYVAGFQAVDHVWEFHYLDNGTLDATKIFDDYTNSNISFMDLLTTDSTSFLFTYYDDDGLSSPEAIVHVYRQYIGEGVFREVERSKADNNGETIVHLVEEDAIYYFLITLEGIPQFISSQFTALCQTTPCEIVLQKTGNTSITTFPTDWDLVDGGAYSTSHDASIRITTLNYTSTGTTSSVWNYSIYRYDNDGTYTLIDQEAESGLSGDITLSVPQVAGNTTFFATIHKDDVFITSEWVDFEDKVQNRLSTGMSVFLALLIVLTLGLIGVSEGVGTIIFVMFGLFLSGALGLINTSLSTGVNIVVYLILAGGILLIKLTTSRR